MWLFLLFYWGARPPLIKYWEGHCPPPGPPLPTPLVIQLQSPTYIYLIVSHMTTKPSDCQPHDYKIQHITIYQTASHTTTKPNIYMTASHMTTKPNMISDCQSHDHKAQHIYQTASHTTTKSNIISDCKSHDVGV